MVKSLSFRVRALRVLYVRLGAKVTSMKQGYKDVDQEGVYIVILSESSRNMTRDGKTAQGELGTGEAESPLSLFSTRRNHSRDAKRGNGTLFASRDRNHAASVTKLVAINFFRVS